MERRGTQGGTKSGIGSQRGRVRKYHWPVREEGKAASSQPRKGFNLRGPLQNKKARQQTREMGDAGKLKTFGKKEAPHASSEVYLDAVPVKGGKRNGRLDALVVP